jgi:hypothetical protein
MCCGVVLFMDSVLYVLCRGFVYGQCFVCVVAWFCLWTVCCMCCGLVFFMDSVHSVLWLGFFLWTVCTLCCGVVSFYGQCAKCVMALFVTIADFGIAFSIHILVFVDNR